MTMRRCRSRSHDGPPVGERQSSLRPDYAVRLRTVRPGGLSDAKIATVPNPALASPLSGALGCVSPA